MIVIKLNSYLLVLLSCLIFICCEDLDLAPDTAVSSSNYFRNEEELQVGLNAVYEKSSFKFDEEFWSDDGHNRGGAGVNNEISRATINSSSPIPQGYWIDIYEGVKRANVLLDNMENVSDDISEEAFNRIEGEARALRAYFYGQLACKFGGVPLITTSRMSIDESLSIERASLDKVKQFIYDEMDAAAQLLPNEKVNKATAGFAYGLKARFALYFGDYETARDASQAVIDLGTYSLAPNLNTLFEKASTGSPEIIFAVPHSYELGTIIPVDARDYISRLSGGFGAVFPTWAAAHIFECTDGLTVNNSPLYDPHAPWANRDPRMAITMVEFGTPWLGYIYEPHYDSLTTLQLSSGNMVSNSDNRAVASFASFTGFLWRKYIDQRWADFKRGDPNYILIRYADVLLMHAESLIELDENLDAARNMINQVRARAYGTTVEDVANYPEVTETTQAGLRTRLRRERRVELMFEGLRYQDLIRWGIAKEALDRIVLGLPNPPELDRSQWPFTDALLPTIDENGLVQFEANTLIGNNWAQLLQDYDFDESRMYLWPIPATDRLLNDKLTQNPNY
ncbi:MAG: RagB/SusD family nutrient uptake outer membrane protein [Cyclobacteriaceae bacterium]|jgi:hypothetical protein